MHYLTVEQLLLVHSMVLDETGGLHGLRDRGRLESAIAAPQQQAFGRELYPTVFDKAAVYARAVIMDHPFVDGNKRTGMTAAFVFLENNGWASTVENGAIEQLALRIARERLTIASIAAWLKRHSQKIR